LPDAHGCFRSVVFPGLWIDREALLQQNYDDTTEALNLEIATQEHRQFVARLEGLGL